MFSELEENDSLVGLDAIAVNCLLSPKGPEILAMAMSKSACLRNFLLKRAIEGDFNDCEPSKKRWKV